VAGCIAEAFACKEITNFSSMYFSRANNVNAHTQWPEGVSEQVASMVFHNSAQKVVKDAIKHTRFQSIAYYHRNMLKQPMNVKQAKALNLYLQKE
jgi:hypothetical protein